MAKATRTRRNHKKKGGSKSRSRTARGSVQVGIPMPEHRQTQLLEFDAQSDRFIWPDMTDEEREARSARRKEVLEGLRFKRGTTTGEWTSMSSLPIAMSKALPKAM